MSLPRWLPALLLGLTLVTFAACARPGAESDDSGPTSFYVDANLGFAIEHPQNWHHDREPGTAGPGTTVAWKAGGDSADIRLSITSLLPTDAVGGFNRLLKLFQNRQPALTVTSRTPLDIEGGAAEKVRAHSSRRAFEVILITARSRAFILAFSAPADKFKAEADTFDKIIDSFRVLP